MTDQRGQSGAELLRAGHQAFNNRDREALADLMAQDITWHVTGNGPAAGTYQGRQAVLEEFFAGFWDAPTHIEDHDVLDSEEHAVALGEVVFELGDEQRSWRVVEVVHHEDGKITERWDLTEDQAGLDKFTEQMMRESA